MQYVDDDMDELFKRAAENYPLDTKTADWNKVLAALQNKPETKPQKKGGRNGRFLWLLLLLPLGLICNQLNSPQNLDKVSTSQINAGKNSSSNNITKETGVNLDATISNTNTSVNPSAVDQKNVNAGSTRVNFSDTSVQTENTLLLSKANYSLEKNLSYSYNDDLSSAQTRNPVNTSSKLKNDEPASYRSFVYGIPFHKNLLDEFSTSVSKSLNPLFQPVEDLKQNIQVARKKKFYAGLMSGLDATTVKFQKIENTGSGYGLLFGYQVNKKWSIETGAFLERKYYYSDGKYLNTSKIYMPPASWINDASGDCKMIEIPLALKYNFSTRKNSNWFATAGTSSYIMKKENYTYNYYYGTTGPVPHKKEYKNSSVDLFTTLSVSGGYTHRLGNFGDVRIEPYLKLPVSGMGISKLPFLSTGLQVGVTRKF